MVGLPRTNVGHPGIKNAEFGGLKALVFMLIKVTLKIR